MSGFYKYNGQEVLYAPNFVINKDYTLLRESRDEYDLPVDNWYWFDSREDALTFWGISEPIDPVLPAEERNPRYHLEGRD